MSTARKPFLTYGLACLAGAAGAVLGALVTAPIAYYLTGLAGVSDHEGGRGMFVVFGLAPLGGLAGLILGIWLVLRYRGGYRGFANLAGRGVLVAAGIAVAAAAGLWVYSQSGDVLATGGPPPQAKFEIRLPPNAVLPARLEGVSVDLDTDKNAMPANLGEARSDGARPVIAGAVDLYFRTTQRIIVLRLPGEPNRLFRLKLAGNPPATKEFGPWQQVDFIDDPAQQSPRAAGPGDDYEIRYRVERAD